MNNRAFPGERAAIWASQSAGLGPASSGPASGHKVDQRDLDREGARRGGAMFLSASSTRRSFSIPVNINLQGARRRQGR